MERVYNNLISSYMLPHTKSDKKSARVHGDRELVSHYSDIVKSDKSSPMYIINLTDDKQEYVLRLKELSLGLEDSINRYINSTDDMFGRIAVVSSDDSIEATIISEEKDLPEDMDISVSSLARPQINQGQDYYPDGRGLPGGQYEFLANVRGNEYHFKYSMNNGTRNNTVLGNIAKSINNANIGVSARVTNVDSRKIALRLTAGDTGTYEDGPVFRFEDIGIDNGFNGIVSYYGLNRVIQEPIDAEFEINGDRYYHPENSIVLNESMEINIYEALNEPVHIGYKKDSKQVFGEIEAIFEQYNKLIDLSKEDSHGGNIRNYRLKAQMNGLYEANSFSLNAAGVIRHGEGHLALDYDVAESAFQSGIFKDVLGPESEFLRKISDTMRGMSLNPMDYVDKLIVAYPDYSKEGYAHPYRTSIYSGMLFNYYC